MLNYSFAGTGPASSAYSSSAERSPAQTSSQFSRTCAICVSMNRRATRS